MPLGRLWPVDQVQVDIISFQLFKAGFQRLWRVKLIVIPQLSGNKQLFTRNQVSSNCFADAFLIFVDGGGIDVAMKDDKSAILRMERIRVWDRKRPDEDASDALLGTDDKTFRLDRADLRDCAELVTDRKELAALRHR